MNNRIHNISSGYLLVVLLLMFSTQASAAIIYTADNRYVFNSVTNSSVGTVVNNYVPDEAFSDFVVSGQNSSLNSRGFFPLVLAIYFQIK